MKRLVSTLVLVTACAHEAPPPPAPPPPQASAPQPAATPPPPAAAAPKDPRFSPAAQGQPPREETAAAERALHAGNYERAIQDAKRALQRNERYVPAILVMAKSYFYLRKLELCASSLDTAAQIDDRNAEIYFVRGQLALNKDDKPAALAAFTEATKRDPNHAAAWNNLAAQYLIAHNFEQAENAARRALQITPDSVKAQLNLGSALRGLKRYGDAEAAYRKALQAQPTNADAYFNLGILYLDADPFPGLETMGRLDQAIAQLQRYKQVASYRLAKDDPVDTYIEEAQKAKERERKKIERMRKEAQRSQPKPAPAVEANPAAKPAPKPAAPGGEGGKAQ